MARFDKKGQRLWQKSYAGDAEIFYYSKKQVAYSVYNLDADKSFVVTINKKGTESVTSAPGADIETDMNSDMGPAADKKGFFAERREQATKKIYLVRYLWK